MSAASSATLHPAVIPSLPTRLGAWADSFFFHEKSGQLENASPYSATFYRQMTEEKLCFI